MVGPDLDVCMWTKNSSKLLPHTLARFEQVMPYDVVRNRILVDDHSEDDTVSIAKSFGWTTYVNPGHGVASGANEALRHISSSFFMSLEHDILLASNWWPRIYQLVASDESVAVAQGVRLPSDPTLRAIYSQVVDQSIDNNIYRTKVIKKLRGFPTKCPVCCDAWLRVKVQSEGYRWLIDSSVVSDHVRIGLMNEASHRGQLQAMCTCGRYPARKISVPYLLRITLASPVSGLKMAIQNSAPKAFFVYPLVRLNILQGWLSGALKTIPEHRRCLSNCD
ncbi:MAG: glycosyltransferase family A protein [Candidatus Bathyarchaeia archaeon]